MMLSILRILLALVLFVMVSCSEPIQKKKSIAIIDLSSSTIKQRTDCKIIIRRSNDTLITEYKSAGIVSLKLTTKQYESDFYIENEKVNKKEIEQISLPGYPEMYYHLIWDFEENSKSFDLFFDEDKKLLAILTEVDYWILYNNDLEFKETNSWIKTYITELAEFDYNEL